MSRWVSGSVGQWVSGSVSRRVSGSAGRWVGGSAGQWVSGVSDQEQAIVLEHRTHRVTQPITIVTALYSPTNAPSTLCVPLTTPPLTTPPGGRVLPQALALRRAHLHHSGLSHPRPLRSHHGDGQPASIRGMQAVPGSFRQPARRARAVAASLHLPRGPHAADEPL